MNKKYVAPRMDIQRFDIEDRLTAGSEFGLSQMVNDPEYGWEEW